MSDLRIEVLGTGCARCTQLYEQTLEAVALAGIEATVVKVEKLDEIMARGILMTPGLVVAGRIVSSGRALKAREIVPLLTP